jgi:hypothetical protein
MSSEEKDKDKNEKDLLREMLEVVDEHLAEIQDRLEIMEIFLFIIALPIIIGFIIIIILILLGISTLPRLF